jgi:demethylmenaquinone methyltransferase/2-methoxy-6-polyprenyl-1,4-benzoquinol methylase
MVRLAQAKLGNGVKTLVADAHHLPLPDEAFDAVTCAYGLRNLNNPEQAAREVRRVLRPGGVWAILELTRPRSALWRLMHRLYLRRALPVLGRLAARDKAAYTYLPESIETWAPPSVWREVLQSAGFRPLEEKSLMGGIATLLVAEATWN